MVHAFYKQTQVTGMVPVSFYMPYGLLPSVHPAASHLLFQRCL